MVIGGNIINRRNNGNQAWGHAFALAANEALQNLNIVTGMFSLKDHAILKAGGLTDDDVRNGLLKRCSEIMKESGETGKKEDTRTNNKRVKIGKATDSGKKENKSLHPKCTKCGYHH
nr:hypothetical protein [Tanacetum cinerariifolium]